MRNIVKKTAAVAMVAGAALALAACKSETTNTTTENVSMTDMNTTGTMSDNSAMESNSADMMGDNASNAM
jgi:PBP1b-binding outer membrane lipoprotein LpoB